MPEFNIPAKVRFWLYLIAAVALLTVSYTAQKQWAGAAEVQYVTGLAALLNLLAAAKTDTSGASEPWHDTEETEEDPDDRVIRSNPIPPPAVPDDH